MQRSRGGMTVFLLLMAAISIFGAVLWMNANSVTPIVPVLPTAEPPTESPDVISQLLNQNFGVNATPLPTIEIPQVAPTRPVIIQPQGPSPTPVNAADVNVSNQDSAVVPAGVTPTLPPPTPEVPVENVELAESQWSLPPLEPPLSRDPLGRDHYWFRRPIESNANSSVLFYYSYGSDGQFTAERVHHGIDIPNPIGEEVYATASGKVVFASDGRSGEIDIFQNSSTYGNVVVLEHEFSYQGRILYTLYAHLSAALVTEGQLVEAGQPIALVGNTGRVSGPHVHYEVRLAQQGSSELPRYGETYNPLLWMVPYVGHGVVAGRVVDANGEFVEDVTVTLRNRSTGFNHPANATTYVFSGTVNDVNPDPVWRENFVITDVPVGRYDVITRIEGQAIVAQVNVLEGMTNFVELRPPDDVPETSESSDENENGT